MLPEAKRKQFALIVAGSSAIARSSTRVEASIHPAVPLTAFFKNSRRSIMHLFHKPPLGHHRNPAIGIAAALRTQIVDKNRASFRC
jgi:hypothetical protein